jgi:PAS domain S-box-containing protein
MDFEKLVAAAGDAVVAADPKGRITLWNAAAQRIFGFTPAEALGQSLDLIIPERLRERHWQGYDKVMHSGETRYGAEVLRVPALRKDGRPLSIAFTVTLLKRDDGTAESIVAILRDDTARWNEERALKKRVADLEAKFNV